MSREPLENFTAEELDKLPKWARDKIIRLHAQARNIEEEAKVAYGENPQTKIELSPIGSLGDEKLNLPDSASVRFFLGDNPNRQDWIDVSFPFVHQKGHMGIGVQLRASSAIITQHDCSNSSIVTLADMVPKLVKLGRWR